MAMPNEAPVRHDYNPLAPDQLANPYPLMAAARRDTPIFYAPSFNLYVVTRYQDIWTVLREPQTFSSAQSTAVRTTLTPKAAAMLQEAIAEVDTLVTNDPPSHTRFRGLLSKAFTPRRVAEREGQVREVANALVDRFIGAGSADIVWQFAYPLPMRIIASILGVPDRDLDTFKKWSDHAVLRLSTNLTEEQEVACISSLIEFQRYFGAMIEERRQAPRDDMLTDLVNARLEGEAPLTLPEMLSVLQQLLVAGNETTTNLIGNAVGLFLAHPDRWRAVCADPSLAANAIEEVLRMEAPVQGLFRTTTRPVELGGVQLPAGAQLQLLYASGNRDETEFPDPDAFDIHRANARNHLSFGGGVHFCIGASLARLEGRIALETLAQRVPTLRLAAGEKPVRTPHFFLRGFEHLRVEWG
jgi:cytochrome P450